MAKRVVGAIVGLPFLIAIVYFGGWALAAALFAVAIVGQVELFKAFGSPKWPHFVVMTISAIYIFCLVLFPLPVNLFAIFVPIFVLLYISLFILKERVFTISLLGFFYITALLSAILIMEQNFGLYYVWFIFIGAWGCDTGAYFSGKAFGKRKLAPRLSPNKTVAGLVGGCVAAAGLCVLYAFILYNLNIWEWQPPHIFAIYGLIAALLGQAGDLAASAIKRRTGIKDFGRIIFGHGGVLDRFDSILLVAPFALLFFYFI